MSTTAASLLTKHLQTMQERITELPQATKFSDSWGWQSLPLDKTDLAYMARIISEQIDSVDWSQVEDAEEIFSDLAQKTEWATANLVPNLWSGPQASEMLVSFLYSIEIQINYLTSPDQIKNSLSLPTSLKKQASLASQRLTEATKNIEGLESKITAINNAYDAAEKLPTTQSELAAALTEVEKISKEAERFNIKSSAAYSSVEEIKTRLEAADKEAKATLEKVRAAYRAATSQGLAQAFSDKSESLNKSMMLWVIVLLSSLFIAGLLAHQRFPEILKAVTGTPDWGVVLLNLILGALTIAPTVWVAWVATKQIGQRFRLAEDYGYKAALATAYEGYRSEAANIDPLFTAQLFATALGRLDEIPLRLVERDVHGSPWHELVNSQEFKKAVEDFPSLKERISNIFRKIKPADNLSKDESRN